jgi:divalent metal cation (Fe/Co/Zn/Cd) transporter
MAWLWRAKVHAARALDSGTVRADAACSLACIQLSGVLFVGSLVCAVAPALGWADAVAALLLSAAIAKEGLSTLRAASRADYQGGCGCH